MRIYPDIDASLGIPSTNAQDKFRGNPSPIFLSEKIGALRLGSG